MRARHLKNNEKLARSEEQNDDPEGAGAKVPRFRATASPASGKDRREATPRYAI